MKKTYAKKISQAKREKILSQINAAIEHHEKFKGAYFFTPPSNASGRRYYEEKNKRLIEFDYDGMKYSYSCYIRCSCKNVYYEGDFCVNGFKKNVKSFKAVKKELLEAIETYIAKHPEKQSNAISI